MGSRPEDDRRSVAFHGEAIDDALLVPGALDAVVLHDHRIGQVLLRRNDMPRHEFTSGFQVGRNLGVSDGAVVAHTEVFELIHYRPTTAEVYESRIGTVLRFLNRYIKDQALPLFLERVHIP